MEYIKKWNSERGREIILKQWQLNSKIIVVGDERQATFITENNNRNNTV
jgi:hypothetical protein